MRSDIEYLQSPAKMNNVRRAVVTSVIGQILEWYDFFLFTARRPH